MVAESQTQGVLSHNGSAQNGKSHSVKKTEEVVTVEEPHQTAEFYPANSLGCSDGEQKGLYRHGSWAILNTIQLLYKCCAEEWKARVDLAAIHRLCNNNDWNEGIQNHLTAVVPGRTDQFLIIAFGLLWSQVLPA